MNGRRRRALLTAVHPMLEPGERVEVTTIVALSTVPVGRQFATGLASGMISGLASGVSVTVVPTPTPMYLAMTDRRLIIFRADPMFAKPVEHTMTIQRAHLYRSEIKERVLNSSMVLSSPYSEHSLKLIFPLISRRERHLVAAALPVATG
ncbi:hypothetical protein ACFYU9_19670 [Streptomyces sp. NPDC004327]|uniref:hypothetical protein n=1 Tax=unclassified Streptomyces TaxID=2593676 RepID=UPI0036814D8D